MIVIVTGASGAGKTTLVRALEARALPGVRCHYLDSLGVPSGEEMIAEYGSTAAWQEAMTRRWITRLQKEAAPIAVLDGQVDIAMARDCLADAGGPPSRIILIDCANAVRATRLRELRGRPELASRDMAVWATFLRWQAGSLGYPVIDTSTSPVETSADALARSVLAS